MQSAGTGLCTTIALGVRLQETQSLILCSGTTSASERRLDRVSNCCDGLHLGTCFTTTGGDSKTGAVSNIGMCGFCGQKRSDLDNLHNPPTRVDPADRCNAQTLRGLSATKKSGFWESQCFLHDLQTVVSRLCTCETCTTCTTKDLPLHHDWEVDNIDPTL